MIKTQMKTKTNKIKCMRSGCRKTPKLSIKGKKKDYYVCECGTEMWTNDKYEDTD